MMHFCHSPSPDGDLACPCGSTRRYAVCCGPCLAGDLQPVTAEALMRSRYCAYVLGHEDYLLRTWHPSTRPARLDDSTGDAVRWLGLKILRTAEGGANDRRGTVAFVARYKVGGEAHRLSETSRFVREADGWFYIDGVIEPESRSGRR